jgi:hypothetical protein
LGAVAEGVRATDLGRAWFEYPLVGQRPLTVAVAHDPGTAVICIRATGDANVERTLTAVMSLLQSTRFARLRASRGPRKLARDAKGTRRAADRDLTRYARSLRASKGCVRLLLS